MISTQNDTYSISFHIKYETLLGQNILILGSIPELGKWSSLCAELKWHDSHIWKIRLKVLKQRPRFEYKFVMIEKGVLQWERGPNRIFDFEKHKEVKEYDDFVIKATWEKFSVTFMIYYPPEVPYEAMLLALGPSTIFEDFFINKSIYTMRLGETRIINGINGQFWEYTIHLNSHETKNFEGEYKYGMLNSQASKLLYD